jgi:hypothetical protein
MKHNPLKTPLFIIHMHFEAIDGKFVAIHGGNINNGRRIAENVYNGLRRMKA